MEFSLNAKGVLGRVTFESLDAIKAARGEYQPIEESGYESWVYELRDSLSLQERHACELTHYETPLLESHHHYLYRFHDEFVEAIAQGIWLKEISRSEPDVVLPTHPLAELPLDSKAEHFVSSGIEWQLRRTSKAVDAVVWDARRCSQRFLQFNLLLDGGNKATASVFVRSDGRRPRSRLVHYWTGETLAVDG